MQLNQLPTLVYTKPGNKERQISVANQLDNRRFAHWDFVYGTTDDAGDDRHGRGRNYTQLVRRDHAAILRDLDPPLLFLEDDIKECHWTNEIDPPEESPLVYLGVIRHGPPRAAAECRKNWTGQTYSYGRLVFQPIDATWCRIGGAWGSHCMLWLDKNAMLTAARLLDVSTSACDTVYAWLQAKLYCVTRRLPIWYQADGRHDRQTGPLLFQNVWPTRPFRSQGD